MKMLTRTIVSIMSLIFVLTACGEQGPTLVSADPADDAVDVAPADTSDDAIADDTPVAEDSAPREEEFLLFQYMSGLGPSNLGEATFALVGPQGEPQPSGDAELPVFLIRITAWSDRQGEPVYTLMPRNVALSDGMIVAEGCGTWGGFEKLSPTEFVFTPNQLPEIDGPELVVDGAECSRSPENITLFEVPVALEFVNDGFLLTTDEGHMARFQQIEIEPPIPAPTLAVPETTILQAPTTEAPTTTASG